MMADFYVQKGKDESPEMFACRYIIRRVMSCPDFAWLMLGTGSLHYCVEAVSERNGQSIETIKSEIFKAVEPLEQPRVNRLDEQLEAANKEIGRLVAVLRSLGFDKKGDDYRPEDDEDDVDLSCFYDELDNGYAGDTAAKDLLHYAIHSGAPLTVETLAAAFEVDL